MDPSEHSGFQVLILHEEDGAEWSEYLCRLLISSGYLQAHQIEPCPLEAVLPTLLVHGRNDDDAAAATNPTPERPKPSASGLARDCTGYEELRPSRSPARQVLLHLRGCPCKVIVLTPGLLGTLRQEPVPAEALVRAVAPPRSVVLLNCDAVEEEDVATLRDVLPDSHLWVHLSAYCQAEQYLAAIQWTIQGSVRESERFADSSVPFFGQTCEEEGEEEVPFGILEAEFNQELHAEPYNDNDEENIYLDVSSNVDGSHSNCSDQRPDTDDYFRSDSNLGADYNSCSHLERGSKDDDDLGSHLGTDDSSYHGLEQGSKDDNLVSRLGPNYRSYPDLEQGGKDDNLVSQLGTDDSSYPDLQQGSKDDNRGSLLGTDDSRYPPHLEQDCKDDYLSSEADSITDIGNDHTYDIGPFNEPNSDKSNDDRSLRPNDYRYLDRNVNENLDTHPDNLYSDLTLNPTSEHVGSKTRQKMHSVKQFHINTLQSKYDNSSADDYEKEEEMLDTSTGESKKLMDAQEGITEAQNVIKMSESVIVEPRKIICGTRPAVLVLLSSRLPVSAVIVTVTSTRDKQGTQVQPERLNVFTLRFEAPELGPGRATVAVHSGEAGDLLALGELTYVSPQQQLRHLLHSVTNPLSFMQQAFSMHHSHTEKMDEMLTESLQSNLSGTRVQAFPVGEPDSSSADAELPTLLHFSARFGLRCLTSQLLRCPGSESARNVLNWHGDSPGSLAHRHGFPALTELIQNSGDIQWSVVQEEQLRLGDHGDDCKDSSEEELCSTISENLLSQAEECEDSKAHEDVGDKGPGTAADFRSRSSPMPVSSQEIPGVWDHGECARDLADGHMKEDPYIVPELNDYELMGDSNAWTSAKSAAVVAAPAARHDTVVRPPCPLGSSAYAQQVSSQEIPGVWDHGECARDLADGHMKEDPYIVLELNDYELMGDSNTWTSAKSAAAVAAPAARHDTVVRPPCPPGSGAYTQQVSSQEIPGVWDHGECARDLADGQMKEDPYIVPELNDYELMGDSNAWTSAKSAAAVAASAARHDTVVRPPCPPGSGAYTQQGKAEEDARRRSTGDAGDQAKQELLPGLQELIQLQQQVKFGHISIDQAVSNFKTWQQHHEQQAESMQIKAKNLQQLRKSIAERQKDKSSQAGVVEIIHLSEQGLYQSVGAPCLPGKGDKAGNLSGVAHAPPKLYSQGCVDKGPRGQRSSNHTYILPKEDVRHVSDPPVQNTHDQRSTFLTHEPPPVAPRLSLGPTFYSSDGAARHSTFPRPDGTRATALPIPQQRRLTLPLQTQHQYDPLHTFTGHSRGALPVPPMFTGKQSSPSSQTTDSPLLRASRQEDNRLRVAPRCAENLLPPTHRHTFNTLPPTPRHTDNPLPPTYRHTLYPLPPTPRYRDYSSAPTHRQASSTLPPTPRYTDNPFPPKPRNIDNALPSTPSYKYNSLPAQPVSSRQSHTQLPLPPRSSYKPISMRPDLSGSYLLTQAKYSQSVSPQAHGRKHNTLPMVASPRQPQTAPPLPCRSSRAQTLPAPLPPQLPKRPQNQYVCD
ncbi:uncharacterized protein LOC116950877 isoform X1 [Petromyzon marinus]|uniref:uncharacterized protein LOC116950877 isoform X1 n=1 Tax=Petromyzon marinus TaxID=7757 RepID=UPI003F7082CF